MASGAELEISAGDRFRFGENWAAFLQLVDSTRIAAAEESLKSMLQVERLDGLRFVDVGSGSGLFSLAARNLGANVTSFDYDSQSVACTEELRRRYRPGDGDWTIGSGSVLDSDFLRGLGTYDVVYSWGVLHHTGDMWSALENVDLLAAKKATLFISIYNDQGRKSRDWRWIKQHYVSSGNLGKRFYMGVGRLYLKDPSPRRVLYKLRQLQKSRHQQQTAPTVRPRGMDRQRDLVDWVGGYPFEVATPDEIFAYFHDQGWALQKLKSCGGGIGCNEFVFTRATE